MAHQDIVLGNIDLYWLGSVVIDPLIVEGGGSATLEAVVVSGGTSALSISGGDLITQWENHPEAIIFSSSNGSSITLKGPNNPNNPVRSSSTPYSWTPDNQTELSTWWSNNVSGSSSITTLSLLLVDPSVVVVSLDGQNLSSESTISKATLVVESPQDVNLLGQDLTSDATISKAIVPTVSKFEVGLGFASVLSLSTYYTGVYDNLFHLLVRSTISKANLLVEDPRVVVLDGRSLSSESTISKAVLTQIQSGDVVLIGQNLSSESTISKAVLTQTQSGDVVLIGQNLSSESTISKATLDVVSPQDANLVGQNLSSESTISKAVLTQSQPEEVLVGQGLTSESTISQATLVVEPPQDVNLLGQNLSSESTISKAVLTQTQSGEVVLVGRNLSSGATISQATLDVVPPQDINLVGQGLTSESTISKAVLTQSQSGDVLLIGQDLTSDATISQATLVVESSSTPYEFLTLSEDGMMATLSSSNWSDIPGIYPRVRIIELGGTGEAIVRGFTESSEIAETEVVSEFLNLVLAPGSWELSIYGINCLGDVNTAGGSVSGVSQNWVTVDGDLVAIDGSGVSPHSPCPKPPIHCSAVTSSGAPWITIDGVPVNFKSDSDTCGHSRTSGHSWVQSNT